MISFICYCKQKIKMSARHQNRNISVSTMVSRNIQPNFGLQSSIEDFNFKNTLTTLRQSGLQEMVKTRDREKRKTYNRTPINIKQNKCSSEDGNSLALCGSQGRSPSTRHDQQWCRQLSTRRSQQSKFLNKKTAKSDEKSKSDKGIDEESTEQQEVTKEEKKQPPVFKSKIYRAIVNQLKRK